eukprot:TRINITY_DN8266_c0_g1_i1.p1 TRINITY_DN8266_c0_g1~~TRINITY_DN8266_c0_g1_i1.p1  ORF type:complete len:216 (-),score=45.48 TRINITY_DN8266_c0_g1_i1:24-671(-)
MTDDEESISDTEIALQHSEILESLQRTKRESVNHTASVVQKLQELQEAFSVGREHLIQTLESLSEKSLPEDLNPNDDLTREAQFFSQASSTAKSVLHALEPLQSLKLIFLKPPANLKGVTKLRSEIQTKKVKASPNVSKPAEIAKWRKELKKTLVADQFQEILNSEERVDPSEISKTNKSGNYMRKGKTSGRTVASKKRKAKRPGKSHRKRVKTS